MEDLALAAAAAFDHVLDHDTQHPPGIRAHFLTDMLTLADRSIGLGKRLADMRIDHIV